MVKWENLGIINTRIMNEALLAKWIWRIFKDNPDDACCTLLKAKYHSSKPFAELKKKKGSQFCKGVLKVRQKAKWGMTFQ